MKTTPEAYLLKSVEKCPDTRRPPKATLESYVVLYVESVALAGNAVDGHLHC